MDTYLKLAVAEGCGQTLVSALLDPSIPPQELLERPPRLPPAAFRRLRDPELATQAAAIRAAAAREGLTLITPDCDAFPERLRPAPLRPLVLFARGDLRALTMTRSVAIVGSRTPTPYGIAAAEDFASALACSGFALWSGLAAGIDAAIHRTALRHEAPTVAVLAGGLDEIYPRGHEDLAHSIATRRGVVISEAPPGQRAQRGHFPRRNRIMAGAAQAVLVVEAGLASGSLHTARFAADAGVPVFAVPGPYTSPRSLGCHALIADGAQIAVDPEDMLRRLGVEAALDPTQDDIGLESSADEAAILRVLDEGPRPCDLVQRESGLRREPFLAALFGLVTSGRVRELPGDLVARLSPRKRPRGRT